MKPSSCLFNGQTIASGNSVKAYLNSTVAAGGSCQSETRVCTAGSLSGSFNYSSCQVAAFASCLYNGQTIAHGSSVTAYTVSQVPFGQVCQPQTRTCFNGALTGQGNYGSCTVAGPAACLFNGVTIASGQSVIAYPVSAVPYGQTCQTQTRTCHDGTLSGNGVFGSCVVNQPASCLINGETIPSGATKTFYLFPTSHGGSCATENRACQNGTLSGSAQYSSCQLIPTTVQSALSIDTNNDYSPSLILQAGTLVMYFGGWYVAGQIHDNIYRAECPNMIGHCDAAALLLDSQALGFEHLNDPSVLAMANGTWIMYMTGVRAGQSGLVAENNHVYYSTSSDAIHWSAPTMIASDIWLASATLDPSGNVLLYGNSNVNGALVQYNLGPNGINQISRTKVDSPIFLANVDVTYRPALGIYQIFGEESGQPNQIDYLTSPDGIHWTMVIPGVVKPHPGSVTVRTPATHPTTNGIFYYGETSDPNSTQNKIWGVQWGVQ